MATAGELFSEAESLRDEGKYDDAVAKLREVLEADESHVMAHLSISTISANQEKVDDAIKHGERACELEPEDPQNFRILSVTYRKMYAATQQEEFIHKAEEAMARAAFLSQ